MDYDIVLQDEVVGSIRNKEVAERTAKVLSGEWKEATPQSVITCEYLLHCGSVYMDEEFGEGHTYWLDGTASSEEVRDILRQEMAKHTGDPVYIWSPSHTRDWEREVSFHIISRKANGDTAKEILKRAAEQLDKGRDRVYRWTPSWLDSSGEVRVKTMGLHQVGYTDDTMSYWPETAVIQDRDHDIEDYGRYYPLTGESCIIFVR